MKYTIEWMTRNVPVGELNNFCVLNDCSLDVDSESVTLFEVEVF